MGNKRILIMTFLAPSFGMNLPSRVFISPKDDNKYHIHEWRALAAEKCFNLLP